MTTDIRKARVKKLNSTREQLAKSYLNVFHGAFTEGTDANRVLADLLGRYSEIAYKDTNYTDSLSMAQDLGAFKAVRYIIDMIQDHNDD